MAPVTNAAFDWPPTYDGGQSALFLLSDTLLKSERLTPEALRALQDEQLSLLLRHHFTYTPSFAQRAKRAGLRKHSLNLSNLSALPVLRRKDIQILGNSFFSTHIPASHLPADWLQTSGSTGQPVRIKKTQANALFWSALTLRDHQWNRRDPGNKLAAIRPQVDQLIELPDWGPPVSDRCRTGTALGIPGKTDLERQLQLLLDFQPDILVIYPSNLQGLLDLASRNNVALPFLKHLRTVGETTSEKLRAAARQLTGLELEDAYSSQEAGMIAIQCPHSGLYHIMSEALIVEIVDEAGNPCRAGQAGRVLITDLHNFASPLVRYEIGDYAEAGGECSCGRGLPTLRKILGRERNLIVKPDNTRHWPVFGFHEFSKIRSVLQYQFIQHDVHRLEMRVHTDSPLKAAEKSELREIVLRHLDAPFTLEITESASPLTANANGKFEEFISLVQT